MYYSQHGIEVRLIIFQGYKVFTSVHFSQDNSPSQGIYKVLHDYVRLQWIDIFGWNKSP